MVPHSEKLSEYHSRRDPESSGEPAGSSNDANLPHPLFVIQKHDASNLHYDFRLEVDGVLKSWAVPRGPSTDPSDRRLAVPTEDHPLDYAGFEGVIPEGEYGGGTVLIWDRGSFRNLRSDDSGQEKDLAECVDEGQIEIWLEGEKLQGGYALVRTNMGDDDNWLLVKMDDDAADARRNPVSTEPDSVVSGRSLQEIEQEDGAD